MHKFKDRKEGGEQLGAKLKAYANNPDVLILGLPRGGVPVAFEISKALHAPLDAFIVRKLGVPGQSELAMGAIAMGDIRVFNEDIIQRLGISPEEIEEVTAREARELERRDKLYRKGRPVPELKNRIVILVDDGLATGATMHAAVDAVKKKDPKKIIVAIPVAPEDTVRAFEKEVNVICLSTPQVFYAIGEWYESFAQTTDEEVIAILERSPI